MAENNSDSQTIGGNTATGGAEAPGTIPASGSETGNRSLEPNQGRRVRLVDTSVTDLGTANAGSGGDLDETPETTVTGNEDLRPGKRGTDAA